MPKGLSRQVRDNLEKCRSAAIAAVERLQSTWTEI